MKILVINGPNLNLLGLRKPEVYGSKTLTELNSELQSYAEGLAANVSFYQSNHEGALIDTLHDAIGKFDGIVINPGALTHYSYSLRDAIESIPVPCVEVHLSNIHNREVFRETSVISPVVLGTISGFGYQGYELAIHALCKEIETKG